MRTFDRARPLRLFVLVAAAAACGSSMGGGIAGTSSVLGAISGFGSIIVGGVEFDTSAAVVTIEGDAAQASDLRLGMVATVRGVVAQNGRQGTAESIAVENLAEGPLQAIDVPGMTLRLLSQQVIADGATVFDPVSLEDLEVGETVDVAGFLDANGRIRATRIARKLEDREIELRGFVQMLDRASSTFRINELLVDFTDAIVEGAPPEGLRDGLIVEIEAETPPVDDVFVTTAIAVIDPSLMTEEGDGISVEGFVTEILSPTEFVVSGRQRVYITPETRFEGGDVTSLVLDAEVDIDGTAGADGVVIATEIEFKTGG
jgi:hypothetical protein